MTRVFKDALCMVHTARQSCPNGQPRKVAPGAEVDPGAKLDLHCTRMSARMIQRTREMQTTRKMQGARHMQGVRQMQRTRKIQRACQDMERKM